MASFGSSHFEKILADFKRRLSSEHTELFLLTTFDDLKDSIKRIQTEQAARKGLRNLNKIKPFLNGLKQYAEIIEVFVQAKPEILAFIWGPIKLCLQVASKLNEAFDALMDAYEKIGNSLPMLSTLDSLFCSHPHVKQVLADIFEDILDFHKRAIVFFKHGTWKLTFKLTYHTFSDMFADILKKLDRSRDLLLQSANVAHFRESQDARILFAKEIEVLLDERRNQRRIAIMDWLSSEPKSTIQHRELQKVRAMLPQTTRWIFSQPQMLDWLKHTDYTPCTFWLCGIPGAGKTVIFSSVIDEIRATLPDAQVIYFYCKNNDPLRSHFADIAKSLIIQILQLNPNCLDYLYESMLAGSERRANDASKLLHILDQILTNHDSLYIGIDGLDECHEEERGLFSNLITAVSRANDAQGNVRIIVTSRQEKDLERSLNSAVKFNIKPQNLENDIAAYVTFKMAELSERFKFTLEKEQPIRKEICTRPKGMFLLARLIMDNLLSQDNLEDLNEELKFEVLPHGINEAYGRMLVRIGKASSKNPNQLEKRLQKAKLVLTLLTTSHRALYTHEIQGALAINLEEQNVDFENRHSRLSLDDLCGPIVQIRQSGVVDLIHPTAKEYLWQHHSGYYIKASGAEELVATFCTSYLAFDCFNPGLADDEFAARVSGGDFAFQEYAACNWLKHLESLFRITNIETGIPKALLTAILILQERHGIQLGCSSELELNRLCKADPARVLSKFQQLYIQTDTLLAEDLETEERMPYLLAQIRHSRSVIEAQVIRDMGQDNLEKSYGKSPFRCPVLLCPYFVTGFGTREQREKHCNGHRRSFMCPHASCDYSVLGLPSESALKAHLSLCHEDLSETPVFPDLKPRSLEQALGDAIAVNNLLAIKTLATDLAVFPDRKKGFVLQALTLGYREAALTLLELLGTPSELNESHKKMVALHKACEIGDEEIFDILVEKGADINVCHDENALTIACQNCHLSIARKLLDNKDYNRYSGRASYKTKGALAMASAHGHAAAVSLLLEKDSDHFTKRDPLDFSRALNAAIRENKVSCAKSLLNWGLEHKSKLPVKLRKVSSENIDHMIETLITEQATIVGKDGGTKANALQAAAHKGDWEAVSHLLDLGADIDNLSGQYGTPMMAAASNGKLDIIQLLIERGADLTKRDDRKGGSLGSAIDVAAANCHEAVVRALLDKGAVFAPHTCHYVAPVYGRYTPLQILSQGSDSKDMIKLLLENGADVDATGGVSRPDFTPLQFAAKNGKDANLQLLLEYGADANAKTKDSDGQTALHIAVASEELVILEILLDHGADINATNAHGETALHLGIRLSLAPYQQVTRILVERGADVTAKTEDSNSETALHIAARLGRSEILEVLLDHGADINAINKNGETALILGAVVSVSERYQQVIRILAERGADIEAVDTLGNTTLMVVARQPNQILEAIQYLLGRGVEIFTVNFEGLTALMIAADLGHDSVVECLLQSRISEYLEEDEEVWSAMESATQNGHVKTVRVLLEFLSKHSVNDHHNLLSGALWAEKATIKWVDSDMVSLLEEYVTFFAPSEHETNAPPQFPLQNASPQTPQQIVHSTSPVISVLNDPSDLRPPSDRIISDVSSSIIWDLDTSSVGGYADDQEIFHTGHEIQTDSQFEVDDGFMAKYFQFETP